MRAGGGGEAGGIARAIGQQVGEAEPRGDDDGLRRLPLPGREADKAVADRAGTPSPLLRAAERRAQRARFGASAAAKAAMPAASSGQSGTASRARRSMRGLPAT